MKKILLLNYSKSLNVKDLVSHFIALTIVFSNHFTNIDKHLIEMNKSLYPAFGIIGASLILLFVNHYTHATFIKDYAYILIIAGMLLGIALGRIGKKK